MTQASTTSMQAERAHTAGPWTIRTTNNEVLSGSHWREIMAVTSAGEAVVGEIFEGDVDDGEAAANANLIAASPEMLALLHQYIDDLRYPPEGDSIERRIAAAKAVIAKARGEA